MPLLYNPEREKFIMVVFTNYDNGAVLDNEGMGWVIHHAVKKGIIDANEPSHYENLRNVTLLSRWSELEPAEGEFYFDDLDASIRKWTRLGKKIHFRISTDPMIYDNSGDGVPNWVFEKYNVPYEEKHDYDVSMKFPDYLNPVYKEKLFAFLKALAERYKSNKDIELVDLRGYGEWGEWHSGHSYDSYAQRSEALRGIIDIWTSAFEESNKVLLLSCSYEWRQDMKPLVHAPSSYEEYLYWQGFDYALSKPGVSFRRDGIGGAIKLWDARLMNEYYRSAKNLPMVGEFFINYAQGIASDGVRGYHAEDALEEALMLHPNYLMLMWDSVNFYEKAPQLIEHGLKRMGYRLLPHTVEVPDICENGQYITIKHTWVNKAVGRFIGICNTGICKLKITIEDKDGHVISEKCENTFNLTNLLENQSRLFYSNIYIPKDAGHGRLDIKFELSTDTSQILLPLSPDMNGRYTVAEIKAEQRTDSLC